MGQYLQCLLFALGNNATARDMVHERDVCGGTTNVVGVGLWLVDGGWWLVVGVGVGAGVGVCGGAVVIE